MKIHFVLLVASMLIFSSIPLMESSNSSEIENQWFLSPQVYDMAALPPEDVKLFHITVNGLWNGYFAGNLSSPFAFGIYLESLLSGKTFESDEEFVEWQHEQGLLVPATILTTQGHHSFQGDKLEEWACRSVDGKLCYWDYEAKSYWMNALNDEFIDWCIEHGKKAIDAGADLIVLDEIQGSGFIPMYQWFSQYIDWLDAPGFSNVTIEKFRNFLANKYSNEELRQKFGIDNISSYDLKSRIAGTMYLPYYERIKADKLNKEYFEFLEKGNFQAKKRLIEELREYAEEKGRYVAIAANSYALGTPRMGGYWCKGLLFADLIDFFAFENRYTAWDEDLPSLPRAKWVAWEKLAYASTHAPAVILLGADEAAYIATDNIHSYRNYLSILCAEAYANRGAFVNWFIRVWGKESDWLGCAAIYEFVLKHGNLYGGIIDSPVAILYLYGEGMRNKSDSYLGLAQMLAESNVPYEVIFDGDGYYMEERLSLEQLMPYDLVFIPNVLNITSKQKDIIFQYVEQGGKAVVFDAHALGFDIDEGEVEYGNGSFIFIHDIAYDYYHSYDEKLWEEMENVVKKHIDVSPYVENADRKVIAYPYLQEDKNRIVIHLVNYDYKKWNDEVVVKKNINISIRKPDFEIKSCYVISPDFNDNISIALHEEDNYINITIPLLKIYDVIVLSGKEDNLSVRITKPENAIYIFDKAILPAEKPIIIGKITIKVETFSSCGIEKVEFYIDDELKFIDESLPYEWIWDEFSFGKHGVKVIVYDSKENVASDEINVFIINF